MEPIKQEIQSLAIERGIPFLLSGADGVIFSANQAFCELVGYSEVELKRIGWIKLSVDNDELQADEQLAQQLMLGKIQEYQQWKAYRPRYGSPIPGQLLAIRYPQGTDKAEYLLCWFTPLVNGSRAALDVVAKYIQDHSEVTRETYKAIETMLQTIGNKPQPTKLRAMCEAIMDWGFDNPGKAGTILMAAASLYSVLPQVALRLALPPQPVQIQVTDPQTGNVKPATQQLINSLEKQGRSIANYNEIPMAAGVTQFVLRTPKGNTIEGDLNGMRSIGRRSGETFGRLFGSESGQRYRPAIHGLSRVSGNDGGDDGVVLGSIVPAEQSSKNGAVSVFRNACRTTKRYLQAVFDGDERTPIKTPEFGEMK